MAEDVPADGSSSCASPLKPGARVGAYTIGRMLRHDELGITYAGRDRALYRDVAITEYLPRDIAMRAGDTAVEPSSMRWVDDFQWGRNRFLAEARLLGELAGTPAIVGAHDSLEANGTAYMVSRRVRGQTLASRLARPGVLPYDAIERLLPPLLDGLERAHGRGLLHLAITPSTIMLDREGEPTLIDFRAVAVALAARRQAITAYAPGYAAIELASDGHTGAATDIHALAATLYRCVTGAAPPAAINRLTERMIPATQQAAGRYPYGLLAAIDAGLAFRSTERPVSIAAWRPIFDRREPIPVPADVAALVPALDPLPQPQSGGIAEPEAASGWRSIVARVDASRWHEAVRVTLAAAHRRLSGWLSSIVTRVDVDRWHTRGREVASAMLAALRDRLSSMAAGVSAAGERARARLAALPAVRTAVGDELTAIIARVRAGRQHSYARVAFGALMAVAIVGSLVAGNALRPTDDQARDSAERRTVAETAPIESDMAAARRRSEETARRTAQEQERAEVAARQEVGERARAQAEMKRQQDEAARQRAAETARIEAEARMRAEAEAKRQEEEAARRIAQERARAEAEARQQADAQARAEAEARRQQEEAARQAAEERARAEAEARQQAEAKTRAEADARRQQEEAARQAAEERARAEAEARRRAEAKARADEAARAQAEAAAKRELEEARRAAAERQQAEAAENALALSPRDRRRVQVALTSLGFDTAGIDEVFGPRTRQMVGLWQKRQGAPDTGFLTGAQLAVLLRQAAPALARYDAEETRPSEKPRRAELADTTAAGSPPAAAAVAPRSGNVTPATPASVQPDSTPRSEEYRGSQRVPLYGSSDPHMFAEYTLILRVAGSKVSGVVTRYCPVCAQNGGEERKSYPCNADTLRFGSGFSLHCDPITAWGDLESARIHHSANLGGIAIPLMRTGRGG